MDWNAPLAFEIRPKSGPLRPMVTLIDANHALSCDLPIRSLRTPHWLKAGQLLVAAAETGDAETMLATFEAIVEALEVEGWLNRSGGTDQAKEQQNVSACVAGPIKAPQIVQPIEPVPHSVKKPDEDRSNFLPDNVIPFRQAQPQRPSNGMAPKPYNVGVKLQFTLGPSTESA